MSTGYFDFGYTEGSGYLYVGLTYNLAKFSIPNPTSPYREKAEIGLQTGLGYIFESTFGVEGILSLPSTEVEYGTNYSSTDKYSFIELILLAKILL